MIGFGLEIYVTTEYGYLQKPKGYDYVFDI